MRDPSYSSSSQSPDDSQPNSQMEKSDTESKNMEGSEYHNEITNNDKYPDQNMESVEKPTRYFVSFFDYTG